MEKNPRSFGKHKGLFCVILIDFRLFIENNISMFLSDTGWHFKGTSMPQWQKILRFGCQTLFSGAKWLDYLHASRNFGLKEIRYKKLRGR